MIAPKYILIGPALLSVISTVNADSLPEKINDATGTERELWHKNKLLADIRPVLDKDDYDEAYEDIGGSIKIIYDKDDEDRLTMNLSYYLHGMPEFCKDCYLAIVDKKKCKGDFSTSKHHFDDRRRLHSPWDDDWKHDDHDDDHDKDHDDDHDDDHDNDHDDDHGDDHDDHDDDHDDDPWTKKTSDVTTDEYGDAVGSLPGISNGYKFWNNRCKVAVIWGLVEEDDHRRGRTLLSSRRRTHTKTKKVMRVIGCGVLKKVGHHDDC